MIVIPNKIHREFSRIVLQLRGLLASIVEPFARRRYDARRAQVLQPIEGVLSGAPRKVLLFLIYQPDQIPSSVIQSCAYFVRLGYSPLVISNAPIRAEDLARLLPWAWRVVTRPNFGYDFGGYRDGVWLLSEWQVVPEVLVMLNDSVWFPLCASDDVVTRMEASEADFVGMFRADPFRDAAKNIGRKRAFFGSFFLMFKHGAVSHPAFVRFWQHYRNTSNKYKTVRRGERGLSHVLFDAGVRSEAVFSRAALDEYLAKVPDEGLIDVLSGLVTTEADLAFARVDLLSRVDAVGACMDACSVEARDLATQFTVKQNVLATAPLIMLEQFGVPFIRKSSRSCNALALGAILNAVDSGRLKQIDTHIVDELRARVADCLSK